MLDKEKLMVFYYAFQGINNIANLDEYNLTPNQQKMLFAIDTIPEITIKQLLQIIGISKQALNVACRDLRERNLVFTATAKSDKRKTAVYLTDDGSKMIEEIETSQLEFINKVCGKTDFNWEDTMKILSSNYLKNIQK
ncbi:MarR family winged helix-turn-helix transcriptional regulator [Apilactobacillus apisilvae]|uniref:MarR family winged helix-turn-helix transcriptional regulator n=1 Tax=Apilactobacillus apisilvae TaxID=2923364 RepID=A0ABY4PGR9_9LACO|nr:MarR family winged helix-turn-helix transcriptional regulator [Apilactobacillus apisilvae]UQS84802.1 MarR family winged helix-turn-helix transcriptional regulator [Apilactobacillus apisilvae]